jgi:hypothetical protein
LVFFKVRILSRDVEVRSLLHTENLFKQIIEILLSIDEVDGVGVYDEEW